MNAIYRSRTNLPRSVAFNLPLNSDRLHLGRNRQAQRRRALRLYARRPLARRLRPHQSQRAQLAAALGMEGLTDPGCRQ
jgi:hypothetical protein